MSSFGSCFRVTTYGESHCKSVGCIVDGVPPGLKLVEEDVQRQLRRRRPGQSHLTTARNEEDLVEFQSGTEGGYTLGTPIGMRVANKDHRPDDYSETDLYPRPSHADWTYLKKYGIKAKSGGGRSSARETIGRVAAGAIAEKYLEQAHRVQIVAFVTSVGKIHMPYLANRKTPIPSLVANGDVDHDDEDQPLSDEFVGLLKTVSRDEVDADLTRCPHAETAERIKARIVRAKEAQDSIGGTVTCVIRNCPIGLGEPVFDKFEAKLAHAMLSIPATKGFEIGSGFRGTEIPGSLHNDAYYRRPDGTLGTLTNHSGGIQGGITNGEPIYFRVAFKSPATIGKSQATAAYNGDAGSLAARGRHDPCVVPRAVPIVEAMAALVVMDMLAAQQGRQRQIEAVGPITLVNKVAQ